MQVLALRTKPAMRGHRLVDTAAAHGDATDETRRGRKERTDSKLQPSLKIPSAWTAIPTRSKHTSWSLTPTPSNQTPWPWHSIRPQGRALQQHGPQDWERGGVGHPGQWWPCETPGQVASSQGAPAPSRPRSGLLTGTLQLHLLQLCEKPVEKGIPCSLSQFLIEFLNLQYEWVHLSNGP